VPSGEVSLLPPQSGAAADVAMICEVANALIGQTPANPAKAFGLLRAIFPNAPLTVRAAALHALMRL
jgi:hypothetical protein